MKKQKYIGDAIFIKHKGKQSQKSATSLRGFNATVIGIFSIHKADNRFTKNLLKSPIVVH